LYSTPNYLGDEIKKNKTGGGGTGFWWENLRKTNHLEDLSVHGRIILKGILKK